MPKKTTNDTQDLLGTSKAELSKKGPFDWALDALLERSEDELFEEGIRLIEEESDFKLSFSHDKQKNFFLKVLKRSKPSDCKSVIWPKEFSYYRAPTRKELKELNSVWRVILGRAEPDVTAFWLPFGTSKGAQDASPLQRFTTFTVRNSEDYDRNCSALLAYEQGISISPNKLDDKLPRAFIPEADWFADELSPLCPQDILTLFPPAELEMFCLILGRALIGRDMTVPAEGGDAIAHKFRKMGIIFGKDPGTGKSTMCNAIIEALQVCGYSVANFRNLGEKFNMSSIYTSDLAFKDDADDASIESMLNSSDLKTIVTGGRLRVENKGTDAFDVTPTCAVFLNTNRLDQNALFGKDAGILDRLAVLYTYSNVELQHIERTELCSDSPDLRSHAHLQWLSAKLGTDVNSLMLWLFRHCVDKFMALYAEGTLEQEVARLTGLLRFPISHNAMANVVSAMHLAYFMRTSCGRPLALTNAKTFAYVFSCYAFIQGDPRAHALRGYIKKHWEQLGRPAMHPWQGIRMVSVASLQSAMFAMQENANNKDITLDAYIKLVFSKLTTNQGISIGSGPTFCKRAWAEIVETIQSKVLQELAKQCIEKQASIAELNIAQEALLSMGPANLEYANLAGYDPAYCANKLTKAWQEAELANGKADFLKVAMA